MHFKQDTSNFCNTNHKILFLSLTIQISSTYKYSKEVSFPHVFIKRNGKEKDVAQLLPTNNFQNFKIKEQEPTEHIDAQKLEANVAKPKTEFNYETNST